MEIAVREADGVHTLEIHGRLTIGEPSEQLTEVLQSVVQGGGRKVVVNLNGVPQIDSSGISTLVCRAYGGRTASGTHGGSAHQQGEQKIFGKLAELA